MSEMRFVAALRVFAAAIAGRKPGLIVRASAARIARVREFLGADVEFIPIEQQKADAQ